jgi:hypothetical protein
MDPRAHLTPWSAVSLCPASGGAEWRRALRIFSTVSDVASLAIISRLWQSA